MVVYSAMPAAPRRRKGNRFSAAPPNNATAARACRAGVGSLAILLAISGSTSVASRTPPVDASRNAMPSDPSMATVCGDRPPTASTRLSPSVRIPSVRASAELPAKRAAPCNACRPSAVVLIRCASKPNRAVKVVQWFARAAMPAIEAAPVTPASAGTNRAMLSAAPATCRPRLPAASAVRVSPVLSASLVSCWPNRSPAAPYDATRRLNLSKVWLTRATTSVALSTALIVTETVAAIAASPSPWP